jgi:hypothetical protein
MRRARPHASELPLALGGHHAFAVFVEPHAPAAPEDAIVAFHQRGEACLVSKEKIRGPVSRPWALDDEGWAPDYDSKKRRRNLVRLALDRGTPG